jgi:hypothetical protein
MIKASFRAGGGDRHLPDSPGRSFASPFPFLPHAGPDIGVDHRLLDRFVMGEIIRRILL